MRVGRAMKNLLGMVAFVVCIIASVPAHAAVGTFQVSGEAGGRTYTSVTVNTDNSTVRYNYGDGTGLTLPVPQDQVWSFFWYYASREPVTVSTD